MYAIRSYYGESADPVQGAGKRHVRFFEEPPDLALREKQRPMALVLSRQGVPALDREVLAPAELVSRGAYVLCDPEDLKPVYSKGEARGSPRNNFV